MSEYNAHDYEDLQQLGSQVSGKAGEVSRKASDKIKKKIKKRQQLKKAQKKKKKEAEKKAARKTAASIISAIGFPAIAIILAAAFIAVAIGAIVANAAASSSAGGSGAYGDFFVPRFEAPTEDNQYFNSVEYDSLAGSEFGLFECKTNGHIGNCTAYAYGRAAEILGHNPNLSVRSANYWYEDNKNGTNGVEKYEYGSEPRLGAILVIWNHVAVVEQINSDGSIVTSESGYDSYFFKTLTRPKGDYGLGREFYGFIYVYTGGGTSNGGGLVAIAHQQKGKGGANYWNEMGYGPCNWCAIYAAWLLKHSGVDVTSREVNWDGNVGVWCDNLINVGRFHPRASSYQPKPGDLFIKSTGGYARGHVGIVIEVTRDKIRTSEGNANGTFATATVCEKEYYKNDSCIYGYGDITLPAPTVIGPAINKSDAENTVMRILSSKGLSKAAICGIMGNMMQECSFNSHYYFRQCDDVDNPDMKASGLVMWTDDNFERFKRDCPNWNTSVEAQVEYLWQTLVLNDSHELPVEQKYTYGCSGCLSTLRSYPNTESGARQAAFAFCNLYERPGYVDSQRAHWAAEYFNSY